MNYDIAITEDCKINICDIYNNGYLAIPDYLPDAILVNNVSISYIDYCDEDAVEVFNETLLPLPLSVEIDIACQDIAGTPQFTLFISGNIGPTVPIGTTYNWFIKNSGGAILAMYPNTVQPQWTIIPYSATDVISLEMVLPNGVVVAVSRTISAVAATINCYQHTLLQHVYSINTTNTSYAIDGHCLVFDKPSDGVYNYTLSISYNTTLANNQIYTESVCNYIDCITECDIVNIIAQDPSSDLYLIHQSIKSAIKCQRCEDACTLFEYIDKKITNNDDCGCHEQRTNCC
jgi:hypothetical protein